LFSGRELTTFLAALLVLASVVGCAQERVGPGQERVMIPAGNDPERWGDFVIAQDRDAVIQSTERQGPRHDLRLSEDEGPFDSRYSKFSTSANAAAGDPRVPLLGKVPAGEEFFGFTIVEDGRGAGDAWAHYIRPNLRTVTLTQGSRPALPDDASIIVGWTRRRDVPYYVIPVTTPDGARSPQLAAAAVFLDQTFKVEVNGHKGVLRTYATRHGGSTYEFRTQSVMINWFVGDTLWTFASYFLSPEQALQAAESIRPVTH
jgi:hypothetical protein